MKLYRAMGEEEFLKLMRGETLTNNNDWSKNFKTSSTGFCFFKVILY